MNNVENYKEITIHVNTSEIDQAQVKIDHLIESIEKLDSLILKQDKKLADFDKLNAEKIADFLEKKITEQINNAANL